MANRRTILSTFVAIMSCCTARPCTITYPTVRVGTNFRVRVTNDGLTMGSLPLVLADSVPSSTVFHSTTDEEGYAIFSGVPSGSFLLTAERNRGLGGGVVVDVSTGGPTNITVPFKWPDSALIYVRSVNGIVRGPDYFPTQAQVPLSLSLVEGISGRTLATIAADAKGEFTFSEKPRQGLYFLKINPSGMRSWSGEEIRGMVAINVSQNATEDRPDLDLGWSSCGLGYAQREPHPLVRLPKVCGDISDSEGGAIANAEVFLIEDAESQRVIEQTRSRPSGQFTLGPHKTGNFWLLIRSAGFQPFLQPIRVEEAAPAEGCADCLSRTLKSLALSLAWNIRPQV